MDTERKLAAQAWLTTGKSTTFSRWKSPTLKINNQRFWASMRGECHSSDYHTSLYRIEGFKGVWYPWYREMAVSTCGCFCKQGIGRQHPHRGWRMRDEVSWARRRNLCRISFHRTIIRVYSPFFYWFGVILFAIFRLIWCHISFDRTKIRFYLPFFH